MVGRRSCSGMRSSRPACPCRPSHLAGLLGPESPDGVCSTVCTSSNRCGSTSAGAKKSVADHIVGRGGAPASRAVVGVRRLVSAKYKTGRYTKTRK